MNAQAAGEDANSLQKHVVITTSVIDIYKEAADDVAAELKCCVAEKRALKLELRHEKKENEDLRQANAILRDMRGIKLPKGN